jgi:regulator of protease activity HflC (stomatin/prohibitin superfamily)
MDGMSRNEKIIFQIGRFIVVIALGIWLLPLMFFAWWYVKNIPDKNNDLPFATWLRTHQKRFYDWLSGFFKDWLLYSVFWSGFLWVALLFFYFLDSLTLNLFGFLYDSPLKIVSILYLIYLVATGYLGFGSAKSGNWDVLFWRAEPAARALLGEYDDPNKKPDQDLVRHIVDAEIGINKATWVVSEGQWKMHHPAQEKLAKFGGPGVLIVEEGYALVLIKSGKFSRIVGRGLFLLDPFERPHMIVPLSAQPVRVEVDCAITKDGGVLTKVEGMVFCKLNPGRGHKDAGAQYPFDDDLIKQRVWNPKGGKDARDAYGAVKPICETVLRNVIAGVTLQDFFNDFEQTRLAIRNQLVVSANTITDPATGFQIIAAAINQVEMPKETREKLWQTWAVEKDKGILHAASDGEAYAIDVLEKAKNLVRKDLIEQIRAGLATPVGAVTPDMAKALMYLVEELTKRPMAEVTAKQQLEVMKEIVESNAAKSIYVGSPMMGRGGGD